MWHYGAVDHVEDLMAMYSELIDAYVLQLKT